MGDLFGDTVPAPQSHVADKDLYCKFVVDGGKNHFRASILVRKDGIGSISALSAE